MKKKESNFPTILAIVLVVIEIAFIFWMLSAFFNVNAPPIQELTKRTSVSQKTISYYVDQLPFGIDRKYENSVREATSEWEKVNPYTTFRETDLQNADVRVLWVKEFGENILGHVIKENVVQIGLGDSFCLGKFRPYTYETVLLIAEHEFGHVLGLPHSNNPSNVMYESITTKYEIDIEERGFLPDGASIFYPVCTKRSAAIYSIEVISDQPLDIYVVPSRQDYDLFVGGSTFNHYPTCLGKEVTFYQKTCTVPRSAGIVLRNPTTFGLGPDATFTIKVKEI